MRRDLVVSPWSMYWYAQQVEARALGLIAFTLRNPDRQIVAHIPDTRMARDVAQRVGGLLAEVGPFSIEARA